MSDEQDPRAAGGYARAEKLSPERRKEIARQAAQSRWLGELPQADFEGELRIGDASLSCAVLRDETRIITQATFLRALGRSRSPKAGTGVLSTADDLPFFLQAEALTPFISTEVLASTRPIFYCSRSGGKGVGYDARLLGQVAEVYLKFRDACLLAGKDIPARYRNMIQAADILVRSLAGVGIVALVDEATGYQTVRSRVALQEILDSFLRKELAAWAKRFPDAFYEEIFRLRKWTWKGRKVNPPQAVGRYTNDFVYERLAPGIRAELERRMPKTEAGNRKGKLHQLFTDDIGHPALAQHLHAVTMLMKSCDTWVEFKRKLDRVAPKRGATMELPLPEPTR